ncbi:MAG: PDZ domain-containing protein, partial [Puniceicoccales bacterium]|nr:PDZ domain-containing protein [Puniceicoccales bacterium]
MVKQTALSILSAVAVVLATLSAHAAEPADGTGTKLLRYPDIHRDTVVFSHGGDLWKASANGGTATRLTAHAGQEVFPRFSPDGQWIAFTGQYDGDEQVYVIPVTGGIPRQLTFYPSVPMSRGHDNLVYGWTPDGKSILFRSTRDSNGVTELGTLYTVPFTGGLPKKVGIPTSGVGEFSPDGTKVVYSPIFRDFRTWKRYQGGMVQHLQIFDLKTKETKRLDDNPRTEREPIWIGGNIYFTSDRTGTMNIFRYDTKTEKITQLTDEHQWDVRWATGSADGQIIYELGGELHVLNVNGTGAVRKLTIHVPHDGLAMRPTRTNVSGNLDDFAPAPGGKRLALIAHGDLFTAPVEKGFPHNLTNSSNAHEREPVWSYDGKTIAYVSDKTGEDQLYLQDAKAEKPPQQLTTAFKGQLENLRISPCGRYLAVSDCNEKLWIVATQDTPFAKQGERVEIAAARQGGTPVGTWSPCGGYLAYTLNNAEDFSRLYIYELATRKTHAVTDPLFDVHSPAWAPAGDFLYYLSRREFAPQFSTVEWNFAGSRNTGIYAIALRKDATDPFGPQFDEETTPISAKSADAKAKTDGTDKEKADAKSAEKLAAKTDGTDAKAAKTDGTDKPAFPEPTKIDWEGLAARVTRVPVAAENYSGLIVGEKALYFVKSASRFMGREPEYKSRLIHYDIKERKETTLIENVGQYAIAPDFSKLVYRADGALKASDPKKPDAKPVTIKADNLYADIVPAQEWAEMYNEAWRKYRDFFYVTNMHGYDWEALGAQYRALLPHVTHRSDLNYILGELVSELNVSHAYVYGGKFEQPKRPVVGLAGALFELDEKANRYKIAKIYRGENEETRYRSPLTEIGVDAKVGDYVLAIDGTELHGTENPYRLLQHRSDPVTLTLNTA